jgi:hypothetical protein
VDGTKLSPAGKKLSSRIEVAFDELCLELMQLWEAMTAGGDDAEADWQTLTRSGLLAAVVEAASSNCNVQLGNRMKAAHSLLSG